ncbi:MAG TPA: type I polyketide synthase, partial [Trebonia sp.]
IGHTQAAAGVAGIIKMVLALRHELLPPTLHADEPSPHIDWSAGEVRLLTEAVPWPAGRGGGGEAGGESARPRRAGVSSFGISGTNVHVLIEDAPLPPAAADDSPDDPSAAGNAASVLGTGTPVSAWALSARSAAGLAAQAARLAAWTRDRPGLDPADVAWSLATTRSQFEHRAVVTGADLSELSAGLAAVAAGEPAAGVVSGLVAPGQRTGKTVLVFPGQGGQWAGMGLELQAASPVFAARLAECSAALEPFTGWRLPDVLADAAALSRVDVVQPALWAVMVSLAAVWEAAGVRADAVVGHSQGEIAAAAVAGILTLRDAAQVVALRSQALTALAGRGAMASVAESASAVTQRIAAAGGDGRLSVAVVNGPSATVVSGEKDAVAALVAACAADGVRARVLPVDYASHGPQVEELRARILSALDGISPRPARIPMISAMTGEFLAGPELDARYWYANLRAPVEFERTVRGLAAAGHRVFLEASPHPVLGPAVRETLDELHIDAAVGGTLRRDDGGPARLLASLAEAQVTGAAVRWDRVLPRAQRAELPTYPFQHQRYWAKPAAAGRAGLPAAGLGATGHPLLGATLELAAGDGLISTGRLSVKDQPWLADHAVRGTVLLPGTAFVELAAVAGHQAGCPWIEELALQAPLVIPDGGAVQVQVTVGGADPRGRRPVTVHARPAAPQGAGAGTPWSQHASGFVTPAGPAAGPAADFLSWPPAGAERADIAGLYEGLAAAGYGYGPAFRGVRAAWVRGSEVFAEVALPEETASGASAFGLHPALLDAAMHAAALAAPAPPEAGDQPAGIVLPFAWTGVELYAAGARSLRVRLGRDAGGALSLALADPAGTPVATVKSLVGRPVAAGQLEPARGSIRDSLFGVEWTSVPVADQVPGSFTVLGADHFGLASGLAAAGAKVTAAADVAALVNAAAQAAGPDGGLP